MSGPCPLIYFVLCLYICNIMEYKASINRDEGEDKHAEKTERRLLSGVNHCDSHTHIEREKESKTF